MRIRSRGVGFLVLLVCAGISLAGSPLLAQDANSDASFAQPARDAAKIRAVDSPLWKESGYDTAGVPGAITRVLSEANLRDLMAGKDPATIETMSGESLATVMGNLGDLDDQLVYKPVTPCRLVNTLNAGGAFAGGETRHYNLIGPNNYSGIGGNAAGCGIPGPSISGVISFNTVRALNLNYISVAPGGPGDFRAWPTNQAVPLASVLNYANVGGGLNIANGLVTTTCDGLCLDLIAPFTCGDPCPSGDLSVVADVSGTHLIIDVYGFFEAADVNNLITNSTEGTNAVQVELGDGLCKTLTSCTITNSGSISKDVIVIGSATIRMDHTVAAAHDEAVASISTTAATCDNTFPHAPGTGKHDIVAGTPIGCCNEETVTTTRRFTLAAGATATYYLNAEKILGAGTVSDDVNGAVIECILVR